MAIVKESAAPPKDWWDRLRALAPFIGSIAVPLAIAWVGGSYNASIKDSENRVRYVELAISQLRTAPTPETSALRDWAIELLDSQAPVKLSSTTKQQLKSSALSVQLSGAAVGQSTARGDVSIVPQGSESGAP